MFDRVPSCIDLRSIGCWARSLFTGVLAACLLPTVLQAAQPVLNGPAPRGAQRGKEVEVQIIGERLDDIQELLFYEPGIEVLKLQAVNSNLVQATLRIAADAPLGSHRFRVRTATGLTDLRPFMVGALQEVNELEPNSDFAAPQAIPMNATVNGVADNEDVDYFVVEAKKGDRISAEVEGIRLGITLFDAYVSIMNAGRFELASSDDSALVWQDGVASIVAPEDGKYIIQVRECSYAGNGSCIYRLHVGNFPRPMAVFPPGGKLGTSPTLRFIGDPAGEWTETVNLPSDLTTPFTVFAKDAHGIAPSQNWFRVTDLESVLEAEPNADIPTATRGSAPAAMFGIISEPGDVDHFRFAAKQGEVYDFRVHARSIRSPLDPVLLLMNADGAGLVANDDSGGPDAFFRYGIPADGEYILQVRDHLGNGGPHYVYSLEATKVKPQLSLQPAEFIQYVQPTVSIPKGRRAGLVMIGNRADVGGPLALRAENLPEGVTIEAPEMPANLNVVPVLFSATPEAANSGRLSDFIAKLNDPNQAALQLEGHLQQTVTLVRGQNQVAFWSEFTNRLPVAVTDEVPFDIAIQEPKAPLVRGGQMELKVVATRKEGFTAAIKIDMLWVPPGLGASGSIAIAEGQNEALIPINAAGNAELKTWQIAVRGQATVGNAAVEVCTPFSNLRVADMYLNLAFERAAVEQGQETELVIHMTKQFDFEGTAKVDLFGLPPKVAVQQVEITKETQDIIFKLKTEADAPAGNHNNLFCRVIVTEQNEPVIHNIGTGQLRIDVPLPPKAAEPAPMPEPMPEPAAPVAAEAPPPKRLTRLEQLRLEQAEREKQKKQKSGG